jgi:hypothetical protein
VNLLGGPAMTLPQMREWRQKTLLGVSLRVIPPTGQYDPTKLINLGSNRWTFKPELGLSRRWGHWIFDAYASVILFARNPEFFSRNASYVRFGGDYRIYSAAWQFAWIDKLRARNP